VSAGDLLRRSRAVALDRTGDARIDEAQRRLATAVAVPGIFDGAVMITRDDGAAVDGVAFTAGQTREIAHSLGRAARGFLEIALADQTTRPVLTPAFAAGLDLGRFVRVTATNTGRCYLVVF
jgi:hypothetical protein